jgi:CBS domain-containing protein
MGGAQWSLPLMEVVYSQPWTKTLGSPKMHAIDRTISEFLSPDPAPQASPETTVAAAVSIMKQRHAACLLVTSGSDLVGIFTERDLLNRVMAEGRSLHETTLSDVMTPKPESLCLDDGIAFGINRMALRGFRNIPILDGEGHPVGVLGIRDVIKHLHTLLDEFEEDVGDDPSRAMWLDVGGSG